MCSRRHLVVAALLSGAASLAPASSFSALFPPELTQMGHPAADWGSVEGRFTRDGNDVAYVLYVDPRYPSLYRITRFQVTTVRVAGDGTEVRTAAAEVLIWNAHPGVREPLRCYVLGAPDAAGDPWRSVAAGSDEYRDALSNAGRVYFGHNDQPRSGSMP